MAEKFQLTLFTSGVTAIGEESFNNCGGLTSITLPPTLETIGDRAFNGCVGLRRISIPEAVTAIGDYAFADCRDLSVAKLPSKLAAVSDGCFSGCSSLSSVWIPEGAGAIGRYAFHGCSSLSQAYIPSTAATIGDGAFAGCSSLASFDTGDGVDAVGAEAFDCCTSLTTISLGRGLRSLSIDAFTGCRAISDIRCRVAAPPEWDNRQDSHHIDLNPFEPEVFSQATLSVTLGAAPAYTAHPVWGRFNDICEVTFAGVGSDPLPTVSRPRVAVAPDGRIIISQMNKNTPIDVYDSTGRAICLSGSPDEVRIHLPGIYFIKIGGDIFKVKK